MSLHDVCLTNVKIPFLLRMTGRLSLPVIDHLFHTGNSFQEIASQVPLPSIHYHYLRSLFIWSCSYTFLRNKACTFPVVLPSIQILLNTSANTAYLFLTSGIEYLNTYSQSESKWHIHNLKSWHWFKDFEQPSPLGVIFIPQPLHVGNTLWYMFNLSASSNAGNPTNVKNVDSHFWNPPSYLQWCSKILHAPK